MICEYTIPRKEHLLMDRPNEVSFAHHAVPPVGVCVYETEFETSLYSGLNVYNPNDILLQNCKI